MTVSRYPLPAPANSLAGCLGGRLRKSRERAPRTVLDKDLNDSERIVVSAQIADSMPSSGAGAIPGSPSIVIT